MLKKILLSILSLVSLKAMEQTCKVAQEQTKLILHSSCEIFNQEISALLILQNGKAIVASEYGKLAIWDYQANKITNLKKFNNKIIDLKELSDGNIIVALSSIIYIINSNTGQILSEFKYENKDEINCIEILSSNSILLSQFNKIKKLYTKVPSLELDKKIHNHFITGIKVLSDKSVAISSVDKKIKIWDEDFNVCLFTLAGHTGMIQRVEELDSNRIFSIAWDNTARIWSTRTGECLKIIELSKERQLSYVYDLKLLPNNQIALTYKKNIIIIDSDTGNILKTLTGHKENVYALTAFSDNLLASVSLDGIISVWNIESETCLNTVNLKARPCNVVSDKNVIIMSLPDNRLYMLNINLQK